MSPSRRAWQLSTALVFLVVPAVIHPQGARTAAPAPAAVLPESTFAGLSFRNIGPANMSGRMADVEGVPGDPSILYVGSVRCV